MSLIPLTVYDNLRRAYCSMFASSSSNNLQNIAMRIVEEASLLDVLRLRGVSRDFREAANRRLARYTHVHVRVHDGLSKLALRRDTNLFGGNIVFHPTASAMIIEIDSHSVGIAVDSKPTWKDIKALLRLLEVFRSSVIQVFMDSPIVEILVREVNTKKVNQLLYYFNQTRKCANAPYTALDELTISQLNANAGPLGPMFPNLKHFTVTSNAQQLGHLSKLMDYDVEIDLIYEKREIDIVCLQVILGERWCRSKQRLFRHVNSFKQWSDATSLGVKYLQQFHGMEKKRTRLRV